jgi:hypothetical protein
MVKLNSRQEAFAQAVVNNGGDKVAARTAAGYSMKMSKPAQSVDADNLYNHPKISLRISELQKKAAAIADERFTITVEQRLKWLDEIITAGLEVYKDGNNQPRRENLSAARAAVATLNDMLGVDDDEENRAQPLEIKFTISAPKGSIETTNVDGD